MKIFIVCYHLFNDFSGSPNVLKNVLENLLKKGYSVDLISSRGGVLEKLHKYPSLRHFGYSYHFSTNFIITFIKYSFIQLYTFIFAWRYLFKKNIVFYINTLLPVGPALAGRMMGKRVIYHYHENAFIKGKFYKILCRVMQMLASDIICVSKYQRSFLKREKQIAIIPNALPKDFVNKLVYAPNDAFSRKRILMLSSLKLYKGIIEFIKLAEDLPQFSFELVINDNEENFSSFKNEYCIKNLTNLIIYTRQNDVALFYNRASIVLNLSNKEKILETFGLTIIESMAAGLPTIVPTEGGIADLVEDGVNGYHIDVQELNKIKERINYILTHKELYLTLARNSYISSMKYDDNVMTKQIIGLLSRYQ